MTQKNLDKFKSLVSDEHSGWKEKAEFRKDNKDWLDISFSIALKILSVLSENKKKSSYPKNQKELAEALNCTPQYVSKLLKGSEKLNLETLVKLQQALEINIINPNLSRKEIKIFAIRNSWIEKRRKTTLSGNYILNDEWESINLSSSKVQMQCVAEPEIDYLYG